MWILYHAGIYLMELAIRISSLWSLKSSQWISGRFQWKRHLNNLPAKKAYRIWVHVSSLGEFEQAKPVIEEMKRVRPEIELILSFFSPSGFIQKQDYPHAVILYLPSDIPGNAKYWINAMQPDLAIFVKYDLWPGYLFELARHKIPAILISAYWKPGNHFQSWSLPLTRNLLKQFRRIFFQRNDHIEYFKKIGFQNITVAGDTRIDRCLTLPQETEKRLPFILEQASFDLVAGSTWPEDEELLLGVSRAFNLSFIIAPHDVGVSNIERLKKKFNGDCLALSECKPGNSLPRFLIIDNVGLLSVLYAIGRIAYVGGGFGKGIHNILEPMAHGKPVIIGPKHQKFPEALDMVADGGAFTIKSLNEFIDVLKFLTTEGTAEEKGKITIEYLLKHSGATRLVTNYILESIPSSPEK